MAPRYLYRVHACSGRAGLDGAPSSELLCAGRRLGVVWLQVGIDSLGSLEIWIVDFGLSRAAIHGGSASLTCALAHDIMNLFRGKLRVAQ